MRAKGRTRAICYIALAIALPLLLAVLIGGCGHPTATVAAKKDPPPKPTVQVVSVAVGTLERRLSATGTLMALRTQEATLSPPVSGVLDQLPIRYGERVRQGQVIAHLSTRQLLGQIQAAEATIRQYEVQVSQAQANALQQQAQTRTAIAEAQAKVKQEQAVLEGDRATLAQDQATQRNAQESLTREQALFKDGLVAAKDVQAAKLGLNTAQAQIVAQENTILAQRQTVEGQEQAVLAAKAAGLQDVVKQKEVEVARQQVSNARGALASLRAQMSLYTLRTPLSGQITAIGATVGEKVWTPARRSPPSPT